MLPAGSSINPKPWAEYHLTTPLMPCIVCSCRLLLYFLTLASAARFFRSFCTISANIGRDIQDGSHIPPAIKWSKTLASSAVIGKGCGDSFVRFLLLYLNTAFSYPFASAQTFGSNSKCIVGELESLLRTLSADCNKMMVALTSVLLASTVVSLSGWPRAQKTGPVGPEPCA